MESFSTASNFTSATLEVKIYCVASAAANEGNVTITAIHQGTPSLNEAYYRFGYRNSSLYLQKFNGAFTTLGTGAALDETALTLPGWNTFKIKLTGASEIRCYVNDQAASFSPVNDTDALIDTAIQIGVICLNGVSFGPILADDFVQTIVSEDVSSVSDWTLY